MPEAPNAGFESGPPGSLIDCLDHFARVSPTAEAVVDGKVRLTYSELYEAVSILSRQLEGARISPGQRICFLGAPGQQYWISLLACIRIGAVWTGLNPKYTAREMAYVLGDAKPVLTLIAAGTEDSTIADLAEACSKPGLAPPLICKSGARGMGDAIRAQHIGQDLSPDTSSDLARRGVCLIVYTSGTTGQPKGALITSRNLAVNGWWLAKRLGFQPHRTLVNLPVNHIGCTGDICATTLILGGTHVFMPAFDAAEVLRLLKQERISWLAQVPAQFQLLFSSAQASIVDFASVETATWGGAAMPLALVERLKDLVPDVFNSYGQTECSGTITISDKGETPAALAETVGKPVDLSLVRIAGPNDQPVPAGEAGEIQVLGDHVFAGYLNRCDATRSVLTADGWLRTGDIGVSEPDGNIRLVGRTREMFKSGGYNVYPREIELVIEDLPGVELCAVIGKSDPLWGEIGVAFVQSSASGITAEALSVHCAERLARYKIPKTFIIRSELPLLSIGKIDKAALADLAT